MPKVCVIGGGVSGLAAAKALKDMEIPFDLYEGGDRVGGNWVFENSSGQSSAYRSLHINTSKARTEFSDFRMPASYPDYPHHTEIAAYLQAYAESFELLPHIQFRTRVLHCEPRAHGFRVTLEHGAVRHYDALAVANGHHSVPVLPEPLPGHFAGTVFHSHCYRDPTDPAPLCGRRVLVVGLGNSAVDIACELSEVAQRVFLSARRGAHVLPKYLFGKPLDQAVGGFRVLPRELGRRIGRWLYPWIVGRPWRLGLPKPEHELWQAHPTISSELLPLLRRGKLQPKPLPSEFLGERIRFADGSIEAVDAVIYCTGYRVSFPFFDAAFVAAPDNALPLFRRVFDPRYDNVFFFGLAQPVGAIFPIVEQQAKWVAHYLAGRYHLPSKEAQLASIALEQEVLARRYVRSTRHTMQIDFDDYLRDLAEERRQGARRAERAGFTLPIAAEAS